MKEDERKSIFNDDERLYIEMLQGNIERMAGNSANCKSWMVTIVSALMALLCSINAFNGWILSGILPILLYWYLDVYYLHLERGMRNLETVFLNMFRDKNFEKYEENLFNFEPYMIKKKDLTKELIRRGLVVTNNLWFTKSVILFYGVSFFGVVIISLVLNWAMIIGWCLCGN